jgi:hypothetical protein
MLFLLYAMTTKNRLNLTPNEEKKKGDKEPWREMMTVRPYDINNQVHASCSVNKVCTNSAIPALNKREAVSDVMEI